MKRSRIVAWLLVFLMAFTLVPSNVLQVEAAKTVKVKKVTLNKSTYTLKKGKKVTLKATLSPKKTTQKKLVWSSSNKKIATVSSKGVVVAKKNGKVTITVKVKGTSKKAKCKIVVGTPVTKVKLNISKKELKVGQSVQLKATLSPKKPSVKGVTYKSSNTSVATVSSSGKVKAKKTGTVKITATAKDGTGKKATCTIKVKAATVKASKVTLDKTSATLYLNSKPLQLKATVSPSNATNRGVTWGSQNTKVATVSASGVVTPVSAGTTKITVKTKDGGYMAQCTVTVCNGAIATTENELVGILEGDKVYSSILLKTAANCKIAVKRNKGVVDWSNTILSIDAPQATVENNITFGEVEILAIKKDTYVEHANNIIIIIAPNSHIVISESAMATLVVEKAAKHVELEHHGFMKEMKIHTDGEVQIKGEAAQAQIPTIVDGKATIYTAKSLDITATEKTSLVLQAGSEGTRVNVEDHAHIPEVEGLGSVKVITESDEQTVVAKPTDKDTGAVTIEALVGLVEGVDNAAVADAKVYLLPYDKNFDLSAFTGNAEYVNTDTDGAYRIENITVGNYFLVVRKDGYRDALQTCVFVNSKAVVNNEKITLVPVVEQAENGSISGKIVNSVNGVALADMTVRIRSGNNNLTGAVYKDDVKTNGEGYYQFTEVEPGNYTIQVLDLRANADPKYVSASFNVHVRAGEEASDSGTGLSPEISHEQVRFVLTWGNQASGAPSDLDSHIVGPRVDQNGMFHVYYSDQNYYATKDGEQIKMTDLDWDDTSWEGPETVTIYEKTPGVYYYLIHDFTNRSRTESMELAESQAKVEVYMGNYLLQSFHVPNQGGTVWTVCSYNAVTNTVTPINTMSYQSDPSAVGTNEIYGDLKVTDIQLNEYVESVNIRGDFIDMTVKRVSGGNLKDYIVPTIAQQGATYVVEVDEYGSYQLVLTGTDGKKRQYRLNIELEYGDLKVTSFQVNESVTNYYIYSDGIELYVTNNKLDEIKDKIVPTIAESGATYEIVYDDYEDAWVMVLTGADGAVRRYFIYLYVDWNGLTVEEITCEEKNVLGHVWISNYDDVIEISGALESFVDIKDKLTFRYGASDVNADLLEENGRWYLAIKNAQGREHRYFINYWYDQYVTYGELCVRDIYSNNGAMNWCEIYNTSIELSGYVQSFADMQEYLVLDFGEDVSSHEWLYDEDERECELVIRNSEGTTRTYVITYYYSESPIQAILSDKLSRCSFTTGGYYSISLYGIEQTFEEVKDSIQIVLTDAQGESVWEYDENDGWMLRVTDSEGNTYSYATHYTFDVDAFYGDLRVTEVTSTSNLFVSFDICETYIDIYGMTEDFENLEDSLAFACERGGVTCTLGYDEYNDRIITLTDEESGDTRKYKLYYYSNYGELNIEEAYSSSNEVTDVDVWGESIEIEGIAISIDDIKNTISFEFGRDVASHEWVYDEEEERWTIVIEREDGIQRTYRVYYYIDYEAYGDLKVTDMQLNDCVTYASIDNDEYIYISAVRTEGVNFNEQIVPVIEQDGASYAIEVDEYGNYALIITGSGGIKRKYRLSVSVDYGDLQITEMQLNDCVYDYYVGRTYVDLHVRYTELEQLETNIIPTISGTGATQKLVYDNQEDTWFIILTDTNGWVRKYEIDLYVNWNQLVVEEISCQEKYVMGYAYIESDYISISGVTETFSGIKEKLDIEYGYGVQDKEWKKVGNEWYLILKDADGREHSYRISYWNDPYLHFEDLYVEKIFTNNGTIESADVYDEHINIDGYIESFEELKKQLVLDFGADVVSHEWICKNDELSLVIYSAEGVSRTYRVYYDDLSDCDLPIVSITSDKLTRCFVEFEYNQEIRLYGIEKDFEDIENSLNVELKDSAGNYEWYEDDYWGWQLRVTDSQDNTYTFDVYYTFDRDLYYGDLRITEVTSSSNLFVGYEVYDAYINTYGMTYELEDIADSLTFVCQKEGAVVSFDASECTLTLTDSESGLTREYYVYYSDDFGYLYINDAESDSDSVSDVYVYSDSIDIYGTAESIDDVKDSISFEFGRHVVNHKWVQTEDGWSIVIENKDGVERQYRVYYYTW